MYIYIYIYIVLLSSWLLSLLLSLLLLYVTLTISNICAPYFATPTFLSLEKSGAAARRGESVYKDQSPQAEPVKPSW